LFCFSTGLHSLPSLVVDSVAFHPDDTSLLAHGRGGVSHEWSLRDGSLLASHGAPGSTRSGAAVYSACGGFAATVSEAGLGIYAAG
jgi:hypothetical protein